MEHKNLYDTLYRKMVVDDDHEAFKELFYEFYPSLCVFATRYIPSSETCEDIVQDAFLNIWKNRKTLHVHSSFRNFLITTVRNSCTDYIRKQSSRERYLQNLSFTTQDPMPDEVYTINELQDMLSVALQKLPPNIQSAFQMSRSDSMTYNEIAVEMDISPKTVESYISKALKLLRDELKDYLPLVLLLNNFV